MTLKGNRNSLVSIGHVFQLIIGYATLSILSVNAQSVVFETTPSSITTGEIETELAKYPSGVVDKYLEKILVIKSDKICGRSDWIFSTIELSDNSLCNFRVTIHHELSSIFLHQYNFKVAPVGDEMLKAFINLNGEYKYTYSNSNVEAWTKIEPSTKLGEYFYDRKYAIRNFENDFNVIAEALFSNGHEVIEFVKSNQNLPVSKKIKLVLEFYQKLSSDFTIEYFDKQKL